MLGLIRKIPVLSIIAYLVSLILIILPSVAYRFPLFLEDSATYLTSGFLDYVPVDRPIIYGLFVKFLASSTSLWAIPITQSLIWNYYIHLLVSYVFKANRFKYLLHLVIALLLGVFTGLSYYCSLVMTDGFTPIVILSVFILLILERPQKMHLFLVSIVFLFSTIIHLSHIPLALVVIGSSFLFFLLIGKSIFLKKLKRLSYILSLFFSSILILSSVNYFYGVGFKVSRTNNIVLATRLIESGLVNKHLKKNCASNSFNPEYGSLCDYVDEFSNWPAAGFYLWDFEKSPLYDGPCMDKDWTACWIDKNDIYGSLIKDVLSDQNLLKEFSMIVVSGTVKQLITFDQTALYNQDLNEIIDKYYNSDLTGYRKSLQRRVTLLFDQSNVLESMTFYSSLLIILYFMFFQFKKLSEESKLIIFIVFVALISNALLTSTLSNVVPRYQGRIICLIPLVAFYLLFLLYKETKEVSQ